MEKRHLDQRLAQMRAEGTEFVCGVNAGVDVPAAALWADYDAIVLAGGARVPRGLPVPGAGLDGVHQAMEYLPLANRAVTASLHDGASPGQPAISARGRHVVIIGGGDTGADCLGTAHRQGAASVTQLEILPRPPAGRPGHQPWPTYPMILRVSGAHEEGGERVYAVSTQEFLGDADGRVRALRLTGVEFSGGRFESVPGTERELRCDLVLLAMGFTGAASAWRWTRAGTWPGTPATPPRCQASSSPATWAGASR
jgi:glutamate synthase (NADPH/NADH) small chain